jgi:hypothetical protein
MRATVFIFCFAFVLAGCREQAATRASPQTNVVWQYVTVDMAYLDYATFPKDIRQRWYDIDGQRAETAETVARFLSASGLGNW